MCVNARAIQYFEILRKLVEKISDEVFLLASFFALIIALVGMTSQQSLEWTGRTFIRLYLITVVYSLTQRIMKMKTELKGDASNPTFEWRISFLPAFQNPTPAVKQGVQFVHFDLQFIITDLCNTYFTKVQVESSTQAIRFVLDSPVTIWKCRYGIITFSTTIHLCNIPNNDN